MVSLVLAEYFATRDNTLLFIGKRGLPEPLVVTIPLPIEQIRQIARDSFGTTAGGAMNVRRLDPDSWHRQCNQLVEPLVAHTCEGDILWFVLHDALHYLPLHALQIEGRDLIERNPVCYTPSASVMKFCYAKRKGKRERALVIGDSRNDLLYAREEAQGVAALFGTLPYLRGQATRTRVLQVLQEEQPDVVHFACHGYFRLPQALKSGIMLAPEAHLPDEAAEEDRWNLTAAEIFDLSLQADLVTLSACESGINEQRPGDELIGLTRALIYAGTPSVIVSLWPVNDLSTSLLMQHFYRQWLAGAGLPGGRRMTKARALQAAQQYVKNLTARQVDDYCVHQLRLLAQTRTEEAERVLAFSLGRAYAQMVAGDVHQARAQYRDIRQHLATLEQARVHTLRGPLSRNLSLVEPEHLPDLTLDYTRRPFEHMYYWAPFVLVGDWQ
jgi:CHAT domain-containing protein